MRLVSCMPALAAVAAGTLCLPAAAPAQVINFPATRDNTLYQNPTGAVSNGAGQHLFAGSNSGLAPRRGLVMFDLAGSLPPDAIITEVTLTLHMSRSSGGPATVSVHRVLADWGEGTTDADGTEGSGGPATPGSATWLHRFFDNVLWSTPGGDFAAAVSAIQTIGDEGFYSWSSPAMAADVQAWLSGGVDNFGWLLMGEESIASSAKRFDSRENPDPALRPVLTVHYVPAPSAAAVVLLAVAGGRRRRHK